MAYEKVNWTSTTPVNTTNLNKMDSAIEQHFNEVDADNVELNKQINDINTKIGDLLTLDTTEKSNLVDAINETNNKHNYSTEEQVIGTWIDGRAIYKRSFSGNIGPEPYTTFTTQYSNQNIDVINCYGSVVKRGSGGVAIGGYVNSNYYAGLFIHGGELQIYHGTSLKGGTYTITIEFVKIS